MKSVSNILVPEPFRASNAFAIVYAHIGAARSNAAIYPFSKAFGRREDDVDVLLVDFNRLALQGAIAGGTLCVSSLLGGAAFVARGFSTFGFSFF